MDQYIGAAWRAASRFSFEGMPEDLQVFGNGHINETYRLRFSIGRMGSMYVILQKINRGVFHDPERLMGNIAGVTSWLQKKIREEGGDPERETLSLIPAKDGRCFLVDDDGEYWRAYRFITDATSYDQAESTEDFRQSAVAFGTFQRRLADYPADSLYESIPGFHDTAARFKAFQKAVTEDRCQRAGSVEKETAFVMEHEYLTHCYEKAGEILPLRVTHNDTKLNNVMIDDKTHKGLCVIDLDTVMPGYVMNDFGDSIRFGASSAPEDERDLDRVFCRLDLFQAYTEGFLQACAGRLTPTETRLLSDGALIMTYECGMRFLTDYLQGDTYFRIHRPDQNLDRARCQFRLLEDMERRLPKMREIVEKAAAQTISMESHS